MVKLVIQIPCFNEEKTLQLVLNELPKKIKGISKIEYQIIDDGSTDNTVNIAKKNNCHIISYIGNKGLGTAFKVGIDAALSRGADIVVNTDGDNQYPSKYIEKLVQPILDGKADIVIGDRQVSKIPHFSILKKILHKFGSITIRKLSNTNVQDSVSGFRAYSKEALLQLNITSKFSYCLDTIIQAGKKNLKIVNINITTNPPTRKSRLYKNLFYYMKNSSSNLLRVYIMYEPFKTFIYLSIPFFILGSSLFLRFTYYYFISSSVGLIQSLILGAVFIITGVILFCIGIIADLLATNRKLIEEGLYLQKKNIYAKHKK